MKLSCLVAVLAFIFITPAQARMYQWQDPDTGTTQLSGKPPSWYRSGRIGPRVFVFENGRIIDDTDVVLSDEHRELMRQRAYLQAEEDLIAAKQTAMEASREKTGSGKEENYGIEEGMPEVTDVDEQEPAELASAEGAETGGKQKKELSLEDMKQLIWEWERRQEEKAREIIGN